MTYATPRNRSMCPQASGIVPELARELETNSTTDSELMALGVGDAPILGEALLEILDSHLQTVEVYVSRLPRGPSLSGEAREQCRRMFVGPAQGRGINPADASAVSLRTRLGADRDDSTQRRIDMSTTRKIVSSPGKGPHDLSRAFSRGLAGSIGRRSAPGATGGSFTSKHDRHSAGREDHDHNEHADDERNS